MQEVYANETAPDKTTDRGSISDSQANNLSALDLYKERTTCNNNCATDGKNGAADLPSLDIDSYHVESFRFPGDGGRWVPKPWKPTVDDLQKAWDKLEKQITDAARKAKPDDFLKVAKDIQAINEKFGPTIAADVAAVVASDGLNIAADIKLAVDLVKLAKSPEAAQLSDDVKKVLERSIAVLKLPF